MKRKSFQKQKEGNGLFQGVFAAYSILLLHVLLLAILGCIVLFFRGFVHYMLWIFLGGSALITYSGYRVYRGVRNEEKNLRELLSLPMFRGRSVEVNLLGGMASLKVNDNNDAAIPVPYASKPEAPRQLENPTSVRIRELRELAHLFENKLITLDEYNRTKEQLFNGTTGT